MDQARERQTPRRPIPAHEEAALTRRRERNAIDRGKPLIGLALSGGGIRSATFCLGLLRALAKNGVLRNFDYLSTVSGGGYIGSALGRLFRDGVDPREVEQGLADDRSLLLWWLRSNGRYLVPAGMRDLFQTWAGQLRGFVATQFEVTVIFALVSCVIVLPHLLGFPPGTGMSPSMWWALIPFAAWFAVFLAFAYWWSRDPEDGHLWVDGLICAGALAAAIYLLLRAGDVASGAPPRLPLLAAGAVVLAAPAAWIWTRARGTHPAKDRVRYTIALSTALKCLLLLFALGASDLVSWFIADRIGPSALRGPVFTGAGVAALLVGLARFVLPMLQPRNHHKSLAQLPLAVMANLGGLVLLVGVAMFWLCGLQYFVFISSVSASSTWMHWLAVHLPAATRASPGAMLAAEYAMRWLTVAIPCLLYVGLTGGNLQQINRSSLHAFYRSRLTRSYVSVGNSPPQHGTPHALRFPVSPLKPKQSGDANRVKKLTELMGGDDIDLPDYAPHMHGGPIHLINCCINQTVDDRTDTYNADRKGVYLSVSALGLETGTRLPQPPDHASNPLVGTTLAEWIAISGAAAGSGMGSLTRTGTAAMFFLSGFRLGYWWRNRRPMKNIWWSRLGKSRAALQEMLARFPGLQSPVWYLSDGGHFDNTGVYSLLKRQLHLIVLADCGADPNYVFADLENLIRKARIDLDTTIDFIDPASLPTRIGEDLRERFGTPDSIMPSPGNQHMLLARIGYPEGPPGCLLVIKPRLYCELPLDVAGYADRHPDFPQQSTAEQFFDEAQWESYCQLGDVLGTPVDGQLLSMLPSLVDEGAALRTNAVLAEDQKNTLTRRQRFGATLGASLSLGALATVGVTAWQAWDAHLAAVQGSQKNVGTTEREADSLQTDLEAGVRYDRQMHGRLYALMQRFDDARGSADMVEAMKQLAGRLNMVCTTLDSADRLNEKCREDYYALQAAATAPGPWQQSIKHYRDATPAPAWDFGALAARWRRANLQMAFVARRREASMGVTAPSSAPGSPAPPAEAPPPQSAAPSREPAVSRAAGKAVASACGAASEGPAQQFTVYTQIYDETRRAPAMQLRDRFAALGLNAPGIENVVHTAERNGTRPPVPWTRPVFLYSNYSARAQGCALQLTRWLALQPGFDHPRPTALPLPIRLRGDPNVIEFWIPTSSTPPSH